MKQIEKQSEPESFSQWKEIDKMADRPRWNRVPTPIKGVVQDSLMTEQGFICCYCQSTIVKEDSHVEHFRPTDGYSDLQLNYENLLCSCQRSVSRGVPRHCGHRKGSWFDAELMVSPLVPGCEDRFGFTANGAIYPRCDDLAVKTTIDKLGLNLPILRELRAAAIDGLYDLSRADIGRLLKRGRDGRFREFHTTIRQVLAT